jgi:uncharacterized UPF0146 family protein
MSGDKYIERTIAEYIASHYRNAVEIGVGSNSIAARLLKNAGVAIRCTDIRPCTPGVEIPFIRDDIWQPNPAIYRHADLLYAIRPGVEMVPPLIALAGMVNADLLVYHLGFEWYGDGGEIIDCGVILHRYYRQNPSRVA